MRNMHSTETKKRKAYKLRHIKRQTKNHAKRDRALKAEKSVDTEDVDSS